MLLPGKRADFTSIKVIHMICTLASILSDPDFLILPACLHFLLWFTHQRMPLLVLTLTWSFYLRIAFTKEEEAPMILALGVASGNRRKAGIY